MNSVTVCFAVSMSCVLVSGQFFGSYDNAYRFGYDSSDFGGIGQFGQGSGGAASIRDPRQNRGPVVFPDPPTDGPMETSGVIVGASGFGFVQPGAQRAQSQFAPSRFSNRYLNQVRFF